MMRRLTLNPQKLTPEMWKFPIEPLRLTLEMHPEPWWLSPEMWMLHPWGYGAL
jgi:hypothetical protein